MLVPSVLRTRPIASLPSTRHQQSHLLLPHSLDEIGDDGIVPSTPTLFVPRRSDGFGEAVSSPHVPTSGRFTFNESLGSSQLNASLGSVVPEQTLDDNSMTAQLLTDYSITTSFFQVLAGVFLQLRCSHLLKRQYQQ